MVLGQRTDGESRWFFKKFGFVKVLTLHLKQNGVGLAQIMEINGFVITPIFHSTVKFVAHSMNTLCVV